MEEPIGKFILDNLTPDKGVQTQNGIYIHYSDVCTLLKKYQNDIKFTCIKCNTNMMWNGIYNHWFCPECKIQIKQSKI